MPAWDSLNIVNKKVTAVFSSCPTSFEKKCRLCFTSPVIIVNIDVMVILISAHNDLRWDTPCPKTRDQRPNTHTVTIHYTILCELLFNILFMQHTAATTILKANSLPLGLPDDRNSNMKARQGFFNLADKRAEMSVSIRSSGQNDVQRILSEVLLIL